MLIQIVGALAIGIIAGTFTGLIPGIHINLIGALLLSITASLLITINPIYLATFITAMAIAHTFIDFIPSIFLGCPDTDTELSVLPGHKLLKKGLGYQAIVLTTYGSFAAIFILLIITLPSIFILEKTYDIILKFIPYILLFFSLLLVFLERKKFTALFVFLLTGFLGYSVFNLGATEPLLPLLSGLFGSSMLITSITQKTKIPEQKIIKPETKLLKPLAGAIIASPICSFLPGMGSGQAAIIGNIIAKTNNKGFLVLLGATNTLVMGFSFISLYIISKTRTGAAVALQEILHTLSGKILILILIIILITGIISFFLTIFLAEFFSQKIHKLNYALLSTLTLGFLILIILAISKPLGLIIFGASTLTGIYCISLKVRRTQMMGCLLIPTILFYLL